MQKRWPRCVPVGVPNYFDDQRFGSVSGGGRFMAQALASGQYKEALRLTLTNHYEHDRAAQKREKALLRKHWGDWPTLKERLPRCRRSQPGGLPRSSSGRLPRRVQRCNRTYAVFIYPLIKAICGIACSAVG